MKDFLKIHDEIEVKIPEKYKHSVQIASFSAKTITICLEPYNEIAVQEIKKAIGTIKNINIDFQDGHIIAQ